MGMFGAIGANLVSPASMLHPVLPQSASSDSLGFRPPQFSDDVAWLPAWLQPHVATVAILDGEEEEKDPQKHGGCSVKDVSQSRGNKCDDKDSYVLLVKDTGKEGMRLHLSGDDDSSLSGTPCHAKVLFTLHLSTDGSSGSRYFPTMDISQDDMLNSVEPIHMQSVKDLRGTGEIKQSNRESNPGNMKLFSSTCNQNKSAGPSSQIQCNPQDARKQFQQKLNTINSEDYEIRDAVELSTSASEALVIYELVKHELSSCKLSTTAVLELSLQLKQTRLQWIKDDVTSSNSNESMCSSDGLSDLDDSDMEDAYEDVGLSLASSANIFTKGTSVSHVEETPNSKQHFGEDGTVGSKHECHDSNIYDSSAEKQPEMPPVDLAADTADEERENLVMNKGRLDRLPTKGKSVSEVEETPYSKQHFGEDRTVRNKYECHDNNLYGSGAKKQLEMLQIDLAVDIADAERENLVMNKGRLDLLPSIVCGDDLMMHQLHRRNSDDIKSQQQEDSFGGAKHRKIMHFRENLIETSYLSESADIAPDMCSCVQKHDGSLKSSQFSIPCRTETNVSLPSQDIAKDSSVYLDDPLCLVIPCSISTRTDDYLSARSYDDGKHNDDEMVMPDFDAEAQNMHITSCLKDKIACREKQDKAAANSLDSCLNQRHTTSLDAQNMQPPGWQPCLLQNDSNRIHAQRPESEMDVMEQQQMEQNECHEPATNGAESHISLQNEEAIPLILCHGARHRVQAHKHPISTENEKQDLRHKSLAKFDPSGILQNPHVQDGKFPDTCIPTRKRVCFTFDDVEYQKKHDSPRLTSKYRSRKGSSLGKRKRPCDQQHSWSSQEVKEHLTNFEMKDKKKPIFQGLDFLLTGFPCKKEKEVERILRRYGGSVLVDIPSPPKYGGKTIRSNSVQLPVVICTKKLQTGKFLYGCAVNAFLLQVDWVTDSIEAGYVLLPEKYMILFNQQNRWAKRIQKPIQQRTADRVFCKVGIMLHGEHGLCFELAEVIKHGQGRVYKTLQGLVQSLKNKNISTGIIIAEKESYAARHLRKCASEQKIPMMSTSWIINSIYNGKLLPFEENNAPSRSLPIEIQAVSASQEWTQEI